MPAKVIGGFAAIVAAVVGLGVSFLIAGAFIPLVKTHCVDADAPVEQPLDQSIESGWKFEIPVIGTGDSDDCVRNSVSREVLSAIGVWDLGTPREQVEDAVVAYAQSLGPGGREYFEELVRMRRESDEIGAEVAEDLQAARSPVESARVLGGAVVRMRDLLAEFGALDPPVALASYHKDMIGISERMVTALEEVLPAVRFGSAGEIDVALMRLDTALRAYERRVPELDQELEDALGG